MEFDRKFIEELAYMSTLLSQNCPKMDTGDGFSSLETSLCSSDHFPPSESFLPNYKIGSPIVDSFEVFANAGSPIFDIGFSLPRRALNVYRHGVGSVERWCNDIHFLNYPARAAVPQIDVGGNHSFCFEYVDPTNFSLPDEASYVGDGREFQRGDRENALKKKMTEKKGGMSSKKKNVVKGQWSLEEDRLLARLVEQYGLRKWSLIAKLLNGRIGKQCRERWHNHLRPNIKKDTWTEEEDLILIKAHAEIGNKWAEISKKLPGRTENSIKNRWNATKRRQYSRRKCRSSKYPRSSTLLQNYIKTLSFPNPKLELIITDQNAPNRAASPKVFPSSGGGKADEIIANSVGEEAGLVSNYEFSNVLNGPIFEEDGSNNGGSTDGGMQGKSTCGGSFFDEIMMVVVGPSFMDEEYMEKEVGMDVSDLITTEVLKKEMDLVEMITQSTNNNNNDESRSTSNNNIREHNF